MEAVFHIKPSEFDESFFNEIKSLLKSKKDLEIMIAISEDEPNGILRKETRQEYFARIDKAIENLKKGHCLEFTREELEDFSKQLLNEP